MKILRICWNALLLAACVLGATSCQNSAKKPLSAQPPVKAAPAIADKSANVSKPSKVIAPQAKTKSEPQWIIWRIQILLVDTFEYMPGSWY